MKIRQTFCRSMQGRFSSSNDQNRLGSVRPISLTEFILSILVDGFGMTAALISLIQSGFTQQISLDPCGCTQ
jgi:hypothetical protein